MPSDLARFSIAIPEGLLNRFDEYASRRGVLTNRSEAIRDLIRDALVREELSNPLANVVGSITLVYNHHTHDLTRKIDEVQHAYLDVVVSTMHVHLDHDNCLELIAVQGQTLKVRELADVLLGIKGIVYGKLTTVAATGSLGADEGRGASGRTHSHTHPHTHTHNDEQDDGRGTARTA